MEEMDRLARERSERVSKFIDERFDESWKVHCRWVVRTKYSWQSTTEVSAMELAKRFFASGAWAILGAALEPSPKAKE